MALQFLNSRILTLAVQSQQVTFDSHDVIRYLYRKHQKEYLQELNAHASARYPFTETHRQIGQALASMSSLVQKQGKVFTRKTMLAERTPVGRWQK